MGGNLVALSVHVLNCRVVCILVRDKEGGFNVTAVGVSSLFVEDFIIEIDVVVVDGIIKGDSDHLGNTFAVVRGRAQVAGNLRTVFRTEAIGKLADIFVARRCAVGVSVNICENVELLLSFLTIN